MIRPLALYIGLRYTRAQRRNHFISFISLASIIGIALGVMALITALSISNGFIAEVSQKFFSVIPGVTLVTNRDITNEWPALQKQVLQMKTVQAAAPYASGKVMLVNGDQIVGLELQGIIPEQENSISVVGQHMLQGSLSSLNPNQFNIVLGDGVAKNLGLKIGDKITVITPQASTTLAGIFPRYKVFTVSGIFRTRTGFSFDDSVGFIAFSDANKLFQGSQLASGLYLKLRDFYQAPAVTNELIRTAPRGYFILNWTEQFGAYFNALAMQKIMFFAILLLIIAVAAFNLVSSLVMMVHDKRADIAILRTLGASPQMIMATFIIQGALVGLMGTLIGLVLGLLLAHNATAVSNFLQGLFHTQFITASVYGIDFLPSKIEGSDVFYVCVISFLLSLLATLYPAFVAFRTQPAEALRYE